MHRVHIVIVYRAVVLSQAECGDCDHMCTCIGRSPAFLGAGMYPPDAAVLSVAARRRLLYERLRLWCALTMRKLMSLNTRAAASGAVREMTCKGDQAHGPMILH